MYIYRRLHLHLNVLCIWCNGHEYMYLTARTESLTHTACSSCEPRLKKLCSSCEHPKNSCNRYTHTSCSCTQRIVAIANAQVTKSQKALGSLIVAIDNSCNRIEYCAMVTKSHTSL